MAFYFLPFSAFDYCNRGILFPKTVSHCKINPYRRFLHFIVCLSIYKFKKMYYNILKLQINFVYGGILMKPDEKWIKRWEKKRSEYITGIDFDSYFTPQRIDENTRIDILDVGHISMPSGKLVACDPICGLTEHTPYFFPKMPQGEFPVSASVIIDRAGNARYAAVKITASDETVLRYETALYGNENLNESAGILPSGFEVDSGLAALMDEKARNAFLEFLNDMTEKNPSFNIYDDYFSDLFSQNSCRNPKYQRKLGDWISWSIPGTKYYIPIIQSGYGDGLYPLYFGYGKGSKPISAVLHFIDIESFSGR